MWTPEPFWYWYTSDLFCLVLTSRRWGFRIYNPEIKICLWIIEFTPRKSNLFLWDVGAASVYFSRHLMGRSGWKFTQNLGVWNRHTESHYLVSKLKSIIKKKKGLRVGNKSTHCSSRGPSSIPRIYVKPLTIVCKLQLQGVCCSVLAFKGTTLNVADIHRNIHIPTKKIWKNWKTLKGGTPSR